MLLPLGARAMQRHSRLGTCGLHGKRERGRESRTHSEVTSGNKNPGSFTPTPPPFPPHPSNHPYAFAQQGGGGGIQHTHLNTQQLQTGGHVPHPNVRLGAGDAQVGAALGKHHRVNGRGMGGAAQLRLQGVDGQAVHVARVRAGVQAGVVVGQGQGGDLTRQLHRPGGGVGGGGGHHRQWWTQAAGTHTRAQQGSSQTQGASRAANRGRRWVPCGKREEWAMVALGRVPYPPPPATTTLHYASAKNTRPAPKCEQSHTRTARPST